MSMDIRWALRGSLLLVAPPILALEGKVVLPDGSPLAGATVSILNIPGSTRTDARGMFRWLPDPQTPFEVIVASPAGDLMAPVLVERLPVEGPLTVLVSRAETVTVTAGAAPSIEAAPASALTSIAREDIAQRHSLHLADLIQNLPGSGRLDEGHSAVPSLRGLARGRTLLLIDGARVTAERRAGPSATYLDPFFLESLEVARGPGSVAYGSDAFGGVIDARTRRPEHGAPLGVRFQGSLGWGVPERSAGLEVSRGVGRGGFLMMARAREYNDYRSPVGDIPNSEASDRGLLLRFSRTAGPGLLAVGWESGLGREIGKPDANFETARSSYPREDSHRLTASYETQPGGGFTQAAFSLFAGSYRLVLDRQRRPTQTEPRQIESSDVDAMDYGLRASADRPIGRALLSFGVDLNGRAGLEAVSGLTTYDRSGVVVTRAETSSVEDARRSDAALYASFDAPIGERLKASAGLRADRIWTRNDGGFYGDHSTRHGALSGYAALSAGPFKGLAATAQIARGFRDPTLSDRYFVGPSGRGTVTGNPDLEPESSLQADLALRTSREGLRLGLYAYWYRIEDLIERFESAPGQFAFRNRGLALLRGIELEVEGKTSGGLTVTAGAQLAAGEAIDDGSDLDDSPAPGITLTLRQDLLQRAYVMARAAAFQRDERPGPTEIAVPGYGVLDFGGGFSLGEAAGLRLLLRNVTDKTYPATADGASVPAPGRSVLLTFTAEL